MVVTTLPDTLIVIANKTCSDRCITHQYKLNELVMLFALLFLLLFKFFNKSCTNKVGIQAVGRIHTTSRGRRFRCEADNKILIQGYQVK